MPNECLTTSSLHFKAPCQTNHLTPELVIIIIIPRAATLPRRLIENVSGGVSGFARDFIILLIAHNFIREDKIMARTAEAVTKSNLLARVAKVRTANAKVAAVRAAAETVKDPDAKKLVLGSVEDLVILTINSRKKVIGEIFERLSEKGTPEDLEKLVNTFENLLDVEATK